MLLAVMIVVSLLVLALSALLGLARAIVAGDPRGAAPLMRSEADVRGLRAVESGLLDMTP